MQLKNRIIPKLDIKGNSLVKGVNLEGLRVLGRPEKFAKMYYESGADELFYLDVVASLYGQNTLYEIITKTAKDIFIPLTVGGGVRTIEDIKKILSLGADKVSINSAGIKNPEFISQSAEMFGSSTICVLIEVLKKNGNYFAYTENGRNFSGKVALDWAKEVEKKGAGEIILTSIEQEGKGEGFDIELAKLFLNNIKIPVVINGGAGSIDHVKKAVKECNPSGLAIASAFHYFYLNKMSKDDMPDGNKEYIEGKREITNLNSFSIEELKNNLYFQEN